MQTSNKLREALKRLDELLYIGPDGEVHGALGKAGEIERIVKDALAEPPRNCDVGTATEQSDRMRRFCLRDQGGCGRCALSKNTFRECIMKWAQLPYVEKEGGGE